MRIEKRIGKSILQLLGTSDNEPLRISLTDIAVILYEALYASGVRGLSVDTVGSLIMQNGGFGKFMPVAAEFLASAITSGPEVSVGVPTDGTKSG